jgi:hypothetical protein
MAQSELNGNNTIYKSHHHLFLDVKKTKKTYFFVSSNGQPILVQDNNQTSNIYSHTQTFLLTLWTNNLKYANGDKKEKR